MNHTTINFRAFPSKIHNLPSSEWFNELSCWCNHHRAAPLIEFLSTLEGSIDLLYLDSYNIDDWTNDWEAASHHLKELFAAKNAIKPGTLIVVDDNLPNPKTNVIPLRVGKGRIISELMDGLDIEPYINDYQMGWVWKELD